LEDASLLALLLTRSTSPKDIFKQFESLRRARVEKIVEAGRRQKSNKTEVSTVGMWIRNVLLAIIFRLVGAERIGGKAWRYRIDWEEKDINKVVKEWKDGRMV
jgi:2-polyprenyl-6-methoxyphenol hydroxylase-like FAD-dependent oxidoreductase